MATRLGDILLQQGAVDAEKLAAALSDQKAFGGKLGRTLIDLGYVTEDALVDALCVQLGLSRVDLDTLEPTEETLRCLGLPACERYGLFPVRLDKAQRVLWLATAEPDRDTLQEVAQITQMTLEPLLAPASAIERAIRRHYYGDGGAKKRTRGEPLSFIPDGDPKQKSAEKRPLGRLPSSADALLDPEARPQRAPSGKAPATSDAPSARGATEPSDIPSAPILPEPSDLPSAPILPEPSDLPSAPIFAEPSDIPSAPILAEPSDIPSAPIFAEPSDIPSAPILAEPSDIPSAPIFAEPSDIPSAPILPEPSELPSAPILDAPPGPRVSSISPRPAGLPSAPIVSDAADDELDIPIEVTGPVREVTGPVPPAAAEAGAALQALADDAFAAFETPPEGNARAGSLASISPTGAADPGGVEELTRVVVRLEKIISAQGRAFRALMEILQEKGVVRRGELGSRTTKKP